jgi:hypothetical protein
MSDSHVIISGSHADTGSLNASSKEKTIFLDCGRPSYMLVRNLLSMDMIMCATNLSGHSRVLVNVSLLLHVKRCDRSPKKSAVGQHSMALFWL